MDRQDRPASSPSFYLYEDRQQSDESITQAIHLPKRREKDEKGRLPIVTENINKRQSVDHGPLRLDSPVMTLRDQFNDRGDILKFPIESSHSYSYAHLSPNSLALRLNVLKRSLEILRDRPKLIHNLNQDKFNEFKDRRRLSVEQTAMSSPMGSSHSRNLQSNASSAALAALFRPQMKRADSFPVDEMYSQEKAPAKPISSYTANNSTDSLELRKPEAADEITEIIGLLEQNVNASTNQDLTSTLHNLSLNKDIKYEVIKNKLVYALATPFVDTSVMITGETNYSNGPLSPTVHPSTIALNLLGANSNNSSTSMLNSYSNPFPGGGRPFHSISSGKHALPQSIFTIDCDAPWNVKAANDLACLMFGVSKNMIRSLSLMDLIAPQFREFVTDRIAKSSSGLSKIQSVIPHSEIIFAGEIVAISRPGDKRFAWTSLWAKKKGKLIIFMFDQIPCDALDIVISRDYDNLGSFADFDISSKQMVAGNLVPDDFDFNTLTGISESMNTFLNEVIIKDPDEFSFNNYKPSEAINLRRYFTLQINNENVPCAVTSNPIEIDPKKFEMKLKIHSLPYIAGIFVVDSSFRIVSCNNAIARNLFGWSSVELIGKSIGKLIKNFESIFQAGINDTQDISIVPGLVLPEHFFRKYSSYLTNTNKQQFEEDFINSKGLVGTHVDGKTFNVDVQLRVSAPDTYVLWMTYSRKANNDSEDINEVGSNIDTSNVPNNFTSVNDPLPSQATLRPPFKRTRSVSGESRFTRLPSQLKLFEDQTLPTVTSEIMRHNSTRTPKNTTRKPSTRHSRISSSSSYSTTLSLAEMGRDSTLDTKLSTPIEDEKTSSVSSSQSPSDKSLEEDLLLEEDLQIETKSKLCQYWPQEIGTKRRVKKISEFDVLRDMGEGAYGKVILAQHKLDKQYEIIIKCIDKERILVDTWVRDRKLGTIPSEIQIMATLMKEKHPNIMRIIDFFEDGQYYYLETPIFGNPPAIDLFDYIEIKKDMPEQECQFIFRQICSAVFHLHKHGIVHRDIKDENVIVDERGIIKLIDFGSAGYSKSGPFDVFVGTIDYASPEVLRGEKYDGKPQDVWALGILLYTILYKENPFYSVDEIMEGNLRLPTIISDGPITLIKKILVRDVLERPTITDILEDEWLQ